MIDIVVNNNIPHHIGNDLLIMAVLPLNLTLFLVLGLGTTVSISIQLFVKVISCVQYTFSSSR